MKTVTRPNFRKLSLELVETSSIPETGTIVYGTLKYLQRLFCSKFAEIYTFALHQKSCNKKSFSWDKKQSAAFYKI